MQDIMIVSWWFSVHEGWCRRNNLILVNCLYVQGMYGDYGNTVLPIGSESWWWRSTRWTSM